MSKSESRRTDRQINIRLTADQVRLMEKAIKVLMRRDRQYTGSVSRFMLVSAIEAAERTVAVAG